MIDNGTVAPTIMAEDQPSVLEDWVWELDGVKYRIRIRKLTPRECWRLMNFSDEDFNVAAYETISEGKIICDAKLRGVIERRLQGDTETYALNITNAMQELGVTSTEWLQYLKPQGSEKTQPVSIVATKLEKMDALECAISITKCIESTEMLCTLMRELDQHRTAIIELDEKGKQNTGRFMRITSEGNLNQKKLFTILTVFALITASKIYTSTLQKVSIKLPTLSCEGSSNNTAKMLISNLKMECMYTRVSPSQLYKQAGNSIVRNVLVGIFGQMIPGCEDKYKDVKAIF